MVLGEKDMQCMHDTGNSNDFTSAPVPTKVMYNAVPHGNFHLFSENLGNPKNSGEIPKFSKNLRKFGEIGPNRTREIFCASEMRVAALRGTETCFRFFFREEHSEQTFTGPFYN